MFKLQCHKSCSCSKLVLSALGGVVLCWTPKGRNMKMTAFYNEIPLQRFRAK